MLDLSELFDLASQQFSSQCSSPVDSLLLRARILYLFFPKLAFPRLMGHTILGIKQSKGLGCRPTLCAFVDLSLQQFDGSMNTLKVTPLFKRMQLHGKDNLRPYLCNLLVAPEHRRKGLARQLIKASEKQIKSWGYKDIYLHVEKASFPALSLYLSECFNIKKTLIETDVLFLHKSLNR
eukprot:gene6984-9545_t